jgi:hypothetical protein
LQERPIFEEKHYLGFNKYSVIRRTVFAIFCFLAYYFSDHERLVETKVGQIAKIEDTGDLFFLMGLVILVWSTALIFVLHMKTQVFDGYIIIDGLWTSRKVKIDLNSITEVEIIPYSKYLLNRPVYNLHRRGKIRFYTRGNSAIQLKDKDGLIYIIGSQQTIQLQEAISNQLSNVN